MSQRETKNECLQSQHKMKIKNQNRMIQVYEAFKNYQFFEKETRKHE